MAGGGLPRRWLQEGGWFFSQIASGGLFKKWLQEGFLGSGFRRASQESLPGGGCSRVSHVFPNGFRRASQEVASGGLPRKWSGSSIMVAFFLIPRKWLQEGFPGASFFPSGFRKASQHMASGRFFSQVASRGLPRKWVQEGFPGSGFRKASQEVAPGWLPTFFECFSGSVLRRASHAAGRLFRKWLQGSVPMFFFTSCFRKASRPRESVARQKLPWEVPWEEQRFLEGSWEGSWKGSGRCCLLQNLRYTRHGLRYKIFHKWLQEAS